MAGTETTGRDSVLAAVLSDEGFFPAEPRSLEETGLTISLVESLIAKQLSTIGTASGRCWPMRSACRLACSIPSIKACARGRSWSTPARPR